MLNLKRRGSLEYKKKSGKVVELSEIKSRYGCTTFNTKQTLKLKFC